MGSIDEFNALPEKDARTRLYACLASRRWVEDVFSGRPYRDVKHLIHVADTATQGLSDEEWLAAMRAHPRIGERGGHAPASSEREQRRVMQASSQTLEAIAAENRKYEERFGHVFLIAAAGRSADEILAELRRRMNNDPERELQEAKHELQKIANLRLEKLLFS